MSDESVEEFQEGMHGLPTDFDINAKGTVNLLELTKKYCYD